MKKIIMGIAVLLAGCDSAVDLEQQVDDLYQRMTQEERIAQLRSMYMDDLFDEHGRLDTAKCRELIPNGIGHFSQFCMQKPRDPNELRDRVVAVQQWLMKNTPSGIPALCHEEVLSGINTRGATIYPQQIGQACSFNPELAELKTRQTSTALRKMGGVLSLSPMVDVCRTPSFNRLEESYGEDAYLSAVMGCAFVRGLQQENLRTGVGACSKHYLGYGGGGDSDEKELMEEILLPHETMICLAGSRALMPGYHAMKGETMQCVADGKILTDILRGYLGFDGMVVSDYTAIDQLVGHASQRDNEEGTPQSEALSTILKAAAAINAGNDVDFPFGANYKYLQEALDQGLVAQEAFERAVKDVLRYKFRTGLMDENPYLYSMEQIVLDTPDERQTAYDIATQSIVLLENNGILPLQSHSLSILLTGPNANSMWAMCGDYSFPAMTYFWKKNMEDLEHPEIVTLLEGMQNYINNSQNSNLNSQISLMYSRGCDWTDTIETKFSNLGDERAWEYEILHRKVDSGEKADKAEALQMARQADVIIAAVGENVMLCGENRDRQRKVDGQYNAETAELPGLRLPGRQEQYVEELLATGKPVVLIVFGGRAQVIAGIAERCAAVIQAWYPGEEGGNAVADILFGRVSPSGKLSVSYPNTEVYEPLCYNYNIKKDPRVQWPFGYGLSYTTFDYQNLKVVGHDSHRDNVQQSQSQEMVPTIISTADESLTLSFEVKNTGKMAADETAQIYLSPKNSQQSTIKPISLQGFARLSLQPGQTKTVTVKLYIEQFGYYVPANSQSPTRHWSIDPGDYIIKVGASSQDIRLEIPVTLQGDTVSKPIREFYFSETNF